MDRAALPLGIRNPANIWSLGSAAWTGAPLQRMPRKSPSAIGPAPVTPGLHRRDRPDQLGFKHQLRSDLAAVVTVTDALDGRRLHRIITTPQRRDDYLRHQFDQTAYVGLV